MEMTRFAGLYDAIVTPFQADGTFNETAYRQIIDFQLAGGLKGLFVCGGGGEGVLMTTEERKRVAGVALDHVGERGTVIVHVGAVSTWEAVELAKHAEGAGAPLVAAVPPFYFGKDEESLIEHFRQIVEAVSIPVLAYHMPLITGVVVTAPVVERLMAESGVAGLKFTDFDLRTMQLFMACGGGKCMLFYGRDEQIVAALTMGAKAGIGSTYNVMPNLLGKLWREFQAGDIKAAANTQATVNQIINVLLRYGGLGACKAALDMLGFDCGPPRGPNRPLDAQTLTAFRADLSEIGYFDLVKRP